MVKQRWVLTMIVKNESKTLPRLWTSVAKYIDGWVICDTGSTDGTLDFLSTLADESGIPGKCYQHQWKNFGHNRSLSFTSAVEWAKEFQPTWDLTHTWAILLDADMILKIVDEGKDPRDLIPSSSFFNDKIRGFEYEQRQGGLHYKNIRMLRLDSPWNCKGKTHEYWNYDAPHNYHEIMQLIPNDMIYIDDRGDGGARSDKFERDERLLREQLTETPNDSRTWFYLAQTLQDLGKWREAHDAYIRRVELGGWEEEKWMAMMRASNCSYNGSKDDSISNAEKENLWAQCVQESIKAWTMRPHRAESLYRLAHWCRIKSKHLESWAWSQMGRMIKDYKDDKLFVEPHAYEDGWWDEISICAYYIKNQVQGAEQEGIDAIDKLLLRRIGGNIDAPAYRRKDTARSNRRFYPFITLYKTPLLVYQGEWNPSIAGWFSCNPSIIQHPTTNSYIVAVRNVNYKIVSGNYVYPPDEEPCIDTATQIKSFRIEKDSLTDIMEISEKNIGWIPKIDNDIREKLKPKWKESGRIPVWGYEDVRLFNHQNQVWFLSTCLHCDGYTGTPRIVLGKMKEDLSTPESITELRVFNKEHEVKGWYSNGCEKNWLPFSNQNEIYAIYSWEPARIIKINPETGMCIVVGDEKYFEIDAGAWRGSTPPVLLKSGESTPSFAPSSSAFQPVKDYEKIERWGCLVHEVISVSGKDVAREYSQRWVEFKITENGIELLFVSHLFVLSEMTIEFPLGCIKNNNGSWIITWGYKDGRARWCLLK